MKKIISTGLVGCFMLMSFGTDLHGAENSGIVITWSSMVDIWEIKDPYEQCLAYVKLKKIEGTDCKKIAESIKQKSQINNNRGVAILPENPKTTNPTIWTGSTGTGGRITKPIKMAPLPEVLPPIRQCIVAGPDCDGYELSKPDWILLMASIGKLSPKEKLELARMIRSYLESKKIKVPSIDLYVPRKDDTKNAIDTKKQEILIIKDEKKSIRDKQEAVRAQLKIQQEETSKNYTGHVTLMKQ